MNIQNNKRKRLDQVRPGSTISFEHDGRVLKGFNYGIDGNGLIKVYVPMGPSGVTLPLPSDTLVEVIRSSGTQIDSSIG